MKVLLSPAKTMNLEASKSNQVPVFMNEAYQLKKALKSMSLKKTESFFKLSKNAARLTQSYTLMTETFKAIELYSGIAFKTYHQQHPKPNDDHLFVLSGLYGIVHAQDGILPYRLDLTHPTRGSLISFWRKKIYSFLKDEPEIISCASKEYESLLDPRLNITFVNIVSGDRLAPSVEAKKVRGALAHHLLIHLKPEGFSFEGYSYIKKDDKVIYIKK